MPIDQTAIVELSSSGPDTANQSNVHALTPSRRSHLSAPLASAHGKKFRRVHEGTSISTGYDHRKCRSIQSRADRACVHMRPRELPTRSTHEPSMRDLVFPVLPKEGRRAFATCPTPWVNIT